MQLFEGVALLAFQIVGVVRAEPIKDALDGMQVFMNGQTEFDPVFYQEMATCFNQLGPRVLQSVGAQWDGMIAYAGNGGNPEANDPWPTCTNSLKWFEYNCTTQDYGKMPIYEPCNYASNVAYYHTATEICARKNWILDTETVNAIGTTFAILGQGSAFMHGSNTINGGSADVRLNDLFAYVAYQAAVQKLEPFDNSIIHDLSATPRATSGIEVTNNFVEMYIEVPVEEWGQLLEAADIPSLRLTMCGYFGTVLTILYPPEVVDDIVDYLLNQFTDISEDIKVFCLQEFLPEVREAQSHFNLTNEEFLTLEGNTFSTLIKLLYAFLWQEEVLTVDDVWLQPSTNEIGTLLLPLINGAANQMNSFTYSNTQMQSGLNMYPGEEWCNLVIPHAKWHLQTGIALTDFAFLTDEVHRIFTKYAQDAY